jgi:hypothetical protein
MAENNRGSDRRQHTRQRAVHALVSEIYSRRHAGQMETGPTADGVVRLRVELPDVDRSKLEKPKSKNFKEVVDPRMETTRGGGIRIVGSGRRADRAGA